MMLKPGLIGGLYLSKPVTLNLLFKRMPTSEPTFPIPKTRIVFIAIYLIAEITLVLLIKKTIINSLKPEGV
jgi:hypothetical protein